MPLVSGQVTIADTATEIVSTVNHYMTVLLHDPTSAADVFLGPTADVTVSNGYEIQAGESREFQLWPGDALWGIVATGTQVLYVMRMSDREA